MSQVWMIVSGSHPVDEGYFRSEADAWARVAVKPVEDRRTFDAFEGGLEVSYEDYCRIQAVRSTDQFSAIGIECASTLAECCQGDGALSETIWIPLNADGTIDPGLGWFATEQEFRHLNFSRRFTVWEDWEVSPERRGGMDFEGYREERLAGPVGVMAVRPGTVWTNESVCGICGEPAHEDEDQDQDQDEETREAVDQWWAATRNPDGTLRDVGPTPPGPFASEWERAQFLADSLL